MEERKLIFCGSCRNRGNAILITKEDFEYKEPIVEIYPVFSEDGEEELYEEEKITGFKEYLYENKLWKCGTPNCNKTFLEKASSVDGQTFEQTLIPLEQSWQRKKRFDSKDIPTKPYLIYKESINAFNQGMNYSCGFLLGSILEAVCIEQKIKEKKVKEEELKKEKVIKKLENEIEEAEDTSKIEELKTKHKKISSEKIIVNLETLVNILISEKRLETFLKLAHTIRDFRNETTHEIYIPKRQELDTSLEMIEELLNEIYIKSRKIETLNSQMKGFKNRRRGIAT